MASEDKTTEDWEKFATPESCDFYKMFLRSKAHRVNTGWESNAAKSLNYWFGDQWESDLKQQLKNTNRAPSVFNMILPAVDTILGHMIQNRIDIMVKAVDRHSDPYIARLLNQVIKQIEKSNLMGFERKAMFFDGLITGVGVIEKWWDTEENIEGKPKASQKDSWDFYLDPNFKKYDYSDARILHREVWMDKGQIERKYGKKYAKMVNFEQPMAEELATQHVNHGYMKHADYGVKGGTIEPMSDKMSGELGFDRKGQLVRVIEEYTVAWEEVDLYWDTDTEEWKDTDGLSDDEKELIKEFIITSNRQYIHLRTMLGLEIIQGEALDATKWHHLFEFFFPYFVNGRFMGVVENLFYPQDEVNKHHSTVVHILNSIANTGIFYTEEAFDEETEQTLSAKLARNDMAIKVNALYDKSNHKTIEYRKPPEVPPIYERLIASGKDDVKYESGAVNSLQGVSERKQSGTAKRTEIAQASTRLAPIIENYVWTLTNGTKGFLWFIQNYYTEETIIRIHGERMGETDAEITLNKQAMNAIANDITVGEYDVVPSVERQTPTERDYTYYKLHELAEVNPQFADIIGKVALKNFDLPEKDQILAEWEQRQMQIQQMQQMGMAQGNNPNRGPIRSAPRPSTGPGRVPQGMQR